MTPIVADIGGASALTTDLGGVLAPLILDLLLVSDTTTTTADSLDDLSLDQATVAPVTDGVLTLNVSQSDTFRIDLTADVTSVILTGWPASGTSKRLALWIVQDNIGGHQVFWPVSYRWSNGVTHTVSATPAAIDCFVFVSFDAGATIFGNVVGLAYA